MKKQSWFKKTLVKKQSWFKKQPWFALQSKAAPPASAGRDKNRYGSPLAFIDMLFNMAFVFVSMFIMTFLIVKPILDAKKSVELKAEYVITMTWPDKSLDDVDLWLLLPSGKKVNFKSKDVEYVTLDRDDRGAFGDTYFEGEKKVLIELNKEIMTIRANVPGRYVVNVHVFGAHKTAEGFYNPVDFPYPVKVTLTKLNPTVVDLATRELIVTKEGEQQTAFAFEIQPDTNYVLIDKEADVPFVQYIPILRSDDSSTSSDR